MKQFSQIGIIKNRFNESAESGVIGAEESMIEVFKEFSEGLFRIEESDYIDVLFLFDRSVGFNLKGPVYSGEVKGVFASRSPNRPSPLGLSRVKLISRSENELIVAGLDALNGSPVIDIKPSVSISAVEELEVIRYDNLRVNPRFEIDKNIQEKALEKLLIMAAQLHGHYCPGLALGVIAGVHGMLQLNAETEGLEEILAIVETNNCFSDGIQFITGCSFGNNALIFKDCGKIACSIIDRNGDGVRIVLKPGAKDIMQTVYPGFSDTFEKVVGQNKRDPGMVGKFKEEGQEKAFAVLKLEFERLFDLQTVNSIEVPEYAPSHDSYICSGCGESTMATRIAEEKEKKYCMECAGKTVNRLSGFGINSD